MHIWSLILAFHVLSSRAFGFLSFSDSQSPKSSVIAYANATFPQFRDRVFRCVHICFSVDIQQEGLCTFITCRAHQPHVGSLPHALMKCIYMRKSVYATRNFTPVQSNFKASQMLERTYCIYASPFLYIIELDQCLRFEILFHFLHSCSLARFSDEV